MIDYTINGFIVEKKALIMDNLKNSQEVSGSKERFLIVLLAGLGDIIIASGAIRALKKQHQDKEICLLTYREHLPLVESCPYLSAVYLFDHAIFKSTFRTFLSLRKCRFKKAINLYRIHSFKGTLKMRMLFRIIGAEHSIGRDTNGRGFFFDQKLTERYPPKEREEVQMLNAVGLCGADATEAKQELWLKKDEEGLARYLSKNKIRLSDYCIGIHPGARRSSHRWPAERFAELADWLIERYGVQVVIVGDKNQQKVAHDIMRFMKHEAMNTTGHLSLNMLAALFVRTKLFITNDTGPMHLAVNLGIKTAVISGQTPFEFLPLENSHVKIIRADSKRKKQRNYTKPISVSKAKNALEQFCQKIFPMRKKRPVKVLHLHTRAVVGGSSGDMLSLLKGLVKEDFVGHVARGNGPDREIFDRLFREHNIPIHEIKYLSNRINPLKDMAALFDMMRLIRREKYEIVHTHNSKAGILGRWAAFFCCVPVIVHTIHSCPLYYRDYPLILRRILMGIERVTAKVTHHMIAVSKHLKDEFVREHIADQKKIAVIFSGIEIEDFRQPPAATTIRRALGLNDDDFVVGTVSRMERNKGYEDIVEAARRLIEKKKNIKFLFVGDGPLKETLKERVRRYGLCEYIIFAGLRNDIPQILHAVDIFCMPSIYEGMGKAVLEAQAAGKPVIATVAGGINDIVANQATAVLLEPNSPNSLARVIERFLEDKTLCVSMGAKAKQFVDARFSAATMVTDTLNLYTCLLIKQNVREPIND